MKINRLTLGVVTTLGGLALAQSANAYEIDAGDVQATIYGSANLNVVYDFNEDIGTSTQAGSFASLTDDNVAEGHFDADALQSRLGFTATHKNGVKIVLEGDFRTGNLRTRHAYGSYKNWTVGRTWSNFNSWTGWTPTLDFDSSAGGPGVQDRVEQVRYTTGDLMIALEKDYFPNIQQQGTTHVDDDSTETTPANNDDGDPSTFDTPVAGGSDSASQKNSLPTLTIRYESSAGDGVTFVVAGLLRHLAVDNGATDDSALGVGAFTGVSMTAGAFTIQGSVQYSDGANAYLYRSGNDFGGVDAYLFNGGLETVSGYGGTLGVSTQVGEGTVNIAYGIAKMDLDDYNRDIVGLPTDTHESNSNLFINYLWDPMDHVSMGVELGYFESDFYGGGSADATRIMYSAGYSF